MPFKLLLNTILNSESTWRCDSGFRPQLSTYTSPNNDVVWGGLNEGMLFKDQMRIPSVVDAFLIACLGATRARQ